MYKYNKTKNIYEVGMACQKVCKQVRNEIKVKVVYKPRPSLHLFHTTVQCRVKKETNMEM